MARGLIGWGGKGGGGGRVSVCTVWTERDKARHVIAWHGMAPTPLRLFGCFRRMGGRGVHVIWSPMRLQVGRIM